MAYYEKLKQRAESLFGERETLMSLWQHIAEHFYVERADFTVQRNLGDDFMMGLSTSYPVLARRELGDVMASMLRPRRQEWFSLSVAEDMDLSDASREWLQKATMIQRRIMYDPASKFVRATNEADHDFVTFGQAVISLEYDRKKNSLLYRCWHLRDVAWREGYDCEIEEVCRKSSMSAAAIMAEFDSNASEAVQEAAKKTPNQKFKIYHIVMPKRLYDGEQKFTAEYVSVFMECDSGHVLREEASQHMIYIIPRWQTVSGWQYAYSPATVAALPDSRLLQSMMLSLMEAGEKATNPPMFARQELFRGDINTYAGGVTYVDLEPEQRLQDAYGFQPVDANGMTRGMEMMLQVQESISKAFYLDRLNLPQAGREMTAFEVSERVTEYIRNALPLFEPLEQSYNAPLCEATRDLLMKYNAFVSLGDMPEELQERDIQFKFESPLHEMIEKKKTQIFLEDLGLIAQASGVDPTAVKRMDIAKALKDSLIANGTPEEWITDDKVIDQMTAQQQQAENTAQTVQLLQAGGQAAQSVGEGAQALQMGGIL